MKYNVDYFIKKFRAIPASKWTTETYASGDKCCALGHCGVRDDNMKEGYGMMAQSLRDLFRGHGLLLLSINDGEEHGYAQKTPRARILAALKDIKKAEK